MTNAIFRMPTDEEKKRISNAIKAHNRKAIKGNNFMASVFGVFAGFGILSIDFSDIKNSFFSLIMAIVGILCVVMFVGFAKTSKAESQIYEKGAFKVIDGYVSEKAPNTEKVGYVNVWFKSNSYSNGWYQVRVEDVEVGTRLILAKPDIQIGKKLVCHVYTPFMLTDEGIKKLS